MKGFEKFIGYGSLGITILFLIWAIIFIKRTIIPTTIVNDSVIAIERIADDLNIAIEKERGFYYLIECSIRCRIVEEACKKESNLRHVIDNAIASGIEIRVLVPKDTNPNKVEEFLKDGPKLQVRVAKESLKGCFRVSGSLVIEETLLELEDKRELKIYKYAPRRAMKKKKQFEKIWNSAMHISVGE